VPAALLETKFYVPRPRHGLVPRPRLSERLDRGTASKLMLVSAPAGFGKTTLLTEWLAAGPAAPADERLAAWLSLDRGDNDSASFWAYVIAALRTVAAGIGENALALLRAPQPLPVEAVLTALLNDLGAIAGDIVLVLDDYHVIDAPAVQDGMVFLLDHLPPGLHVAIASRADPALPLARLRVRGELAEIRAAELRFTPDEAAAYLNEMMGLELTARDVAALEARTEGWIAALQLAALSMQGRDDVTGFIAGFAGDDRYVVDYLAEEVLQRQTDRVQAFLLQTSVLGRLSGPLCDAVTGQGGGKAMLEALDRGNLFLVPLDDRRRWCCRRGCSTSRAARCRSCTGGRARGMSRTASGPWPSATRWPPEISGGQRTWSNWRSRQWPGPGRRPRYVAGSRNSPTTWSASGPCSASASPGHCLLAASSRALRAGSGTPSGGWTRQRVPVRDPNPRRRRWSSPTRRSTAVSRRRSRCTAPGWRWPAVIFPAP
jgi:hypothetical protein